MSNRYMIEVCEVCGKIGTEKEIATTSHYRGITYEFPDNETELNDDESITLHKGCGGQILIAIGDTFKEAISDAKSMSRNGQVK